MSRSYFSGCIIYFYSSFFTTYLVCFYGIFQEFLSLSKHLWSCEHNTNILYVLLRIIDMFLYTERKCFYNFFRSISESSYCTTSNICFRYRFPSTREDISSPFQCRKDCICRFLTDLSGDFRRKSYDIPCCIERLSSEGESL